MILAVSHFKSQTIGEDGIPHSIVAKALAVIAPFLTRLFKSSLDNVIFPPARKRVRIIALKKITVPSSSSDFWAIPQLCFLSKVQEKLAYDQVINFFVMEKILDSFQSGFR